MYPLQFDVLARCLGTGLTRRTALRIVAGAGAAVLPLALTSPASAFRTFSGCKKHCQRFDGQCQSDCVKCCRKTVKGNQQRCSFGCGVIKGKKKS